MNPREDELQSWLADLGAYKVAIRQLLRSVTEARGCSLSELVVVAVPQAIGVAFPELRAGLLEHAVAREWLDGRLFFVVPRAGALAVLGPAAGVLSRTEPECSHLVWFCAAGLGVMLFEPFSQEPVRALSAAFPRGEGARKDTTGP